MNFMEEWLSINDLDDNFKWIATNDFCLNQRKVSLLIYLVIYFPVLVKKTAERIVTVLGEAALSKILNDQSVLEQVNGLPKDKQEKIYQILHENQGFEHIVIELSKYGFGLKMAQKNVQRLS